jgi:hypothetical protein
MRALVGERDVPRLASWKVRAEPNGWEAALAFDNSRVTRWSSWEASRPGQFIEMAFPAPRIVDAVGLECAAEDHSKLRLEGRLAAGGWKRLSEAPDAAEVPAPAGMRRDAMLEFKARGIHYLLMGDGDFAWQDMRKYPIYWGVTEVAESGGTHLVRID